MEKFAKKTSPRSTVFIRCNKTLNFYILSIISLRLIYSFFFDEESIGKSKAEVATRLLLELNPDVHGDFIDESVHQILENNPTFFNYFTVVVGIALTES